MASVVDYGKVAGDKLNAPKLGGTDGWAAAIAAALNNSDATVDARIATAVGDRVLKTGDTMTGYLTISRAAGADVGVNISTAGVSRWLFGRNGVAETGANAGSDFVVARYNDAGTWVSNPLSINRADGSSQIQHGLYLNGWFTAVQGVHNNNQLLTGVATPTAGTDAANKTYVDTKAPLSHSHVIGDLPTGTTGTTVALGNHLHAGVYASVSHSHLIADLPTGTTGTTVALGNHTHSTYALTSHSHVIGDLPTGTTGTTVALGNHTHSYEASGAVATHDALATAHSALRGTATPASLKTSPSVIGTATKFAREDHSHQVLVDVPVALGSANAEGTSQNMARSDHVHIYPTAANVGALPLAGGTISGGLTVNGQLTASTDLAVTGDAYLYGDLMMNSANTAKRRIYWPGDTVLAVGAGGNVSISDTTFQVYRPMRVGALTADSLAVIDPADPYSGQGFISWVGGVLDLSSTSWVGGTPYVRYNQVPTQSDELVNKAYVDSKQEVTVSNVAPSGAPARDGLMWVVVP